MSEPRHISVCIEEWLTALGAEPQDDPREPRTASTRCESIDAAWERCPNAATTTVTIDGDNYGACDVCAGPKENS